MPTASQRTVAPRLAAFVLLALAPFLTVLSGCSEPEPVRLEKIYTLAATNPAGAQAEIVRQWTADDLTMQGALGLAHDRLDQRNDAASVAYATAVLGAIAQLEGPITKKNVNEFFWMRTGTLAGKAAAVSMSLANTAAANAVVLAGPTRWQTDAYWQQNPGHDALASYILHASGRTAEALSRLRSRPEMAPEVQKAYDEISAAARAAKR